jgi:VWFA-related protein
MKACPAVVLAGVFVLAKAQQLPIFRTSVTLVRIDARVTDGWGTTLDGLHKEDFCVRDEGEPQTVLHLSQEESPLDVVLLFDISRSMGPNIRRIAASASTALTELREGDQVAVMSFDFASYLVMPFTADLGSAARMIVQRIPRTAFDGSTNLQESADDAARFLLKSSVDPDRRRAVIIFTDNDGYGREIQKAAIRHFWQADAVLNAVLLTSPESIQTHERRLYAPDDVMPILESTGGEWIAGSGGGTEFRDMMLHIRKRYTLYYGMPAGKSGAVRHITVDVSSDVKKRYPEASVLAREGYVVPKGFPGRQ